MSKRRILISDSSEYIRNNIKNLLLKRGYQVYEATNDSETLRLARSIYPELVILDLNLWGMNSFKVGKIIEEDNVSTVIYMTSNVDKSFLNHIKNMKIYAYIKKPIISENLYQTIEFALINSNKINKLEKKIDVLEAKTILMKNFNISENEAYNRIRKESMDRCISIEKLSKEIRNKNNKSI